MEDDLDQYREVYNQGTILLEEGEESRDFFLIKEGIVKVFKEMNDDRVVLANIGPEEILGEMTLLDEKDQRSATAVADTRVVCWKLNEKQFNQLMEKEEGFRNRIFRSISERLRKTNQQYAQTHRVEKLLYQCAFLVMYLMDEKNWYTPSRQQLKFNPSTRALKSRFDFDDNILATMFSNPTYEELQGVSHQLRPDISSAAKKIVEDTLDQIELSLPEMEPTEQQDDLSRLESADSIVKAGERLCAILDNTGDELTPDQYRSLHDEYKQLEEHHEEMSDGSYPKRRLGAFLESVRRQLSNVSPGGGENEEKSNDA